MAVLDEAQRKKFATIGKDRYPMPDVSHAKLALSMVNKGNLSHEQKMTVIKKASAMMKKA